MVTFRIDDSLVPYGFAFDFMKKYADEVKNGKKDELLWFLEHEDVITRGIHAADAELLNSLLPVVNTDRGGKFTYHGRGQLVIYTIFNIAERKINIEDFVYMLEEWIIDSLGFAGIKANRSYLGKGVFVGDSKISFIGLRLRKGVSYHGISLNVCPDLRNFSSIIPCGLKDVHITSMKELGADLSVCEMTNILMNRFKKMPLYA